MVVADEAGVEVVAAALVVRCARVFGACVVVGELADVVGQEGFVFCFVDVEDEEFDCVGVVVGEVDEVFGMFL